LVKLDLHRKAAKSAEENSFLLPPVGGKGKDAAERNNQADVRAVPFNFSLFAAQR
jgi:hypothetical protein